MDETNPHLLWWGKEMEQKHHLFTLPKPLTPQEIWDKLWVSGWGYNSLSQTYKGQIYTIRKIVGGYQ
jgi:hypothetical protein